MYVQFRFVRIFGCLTLVHMSSTRHQTPPGNNLGIHFMSPFLIVWFFLVKSHHSYQVRTGFTGREQSTGKQLLRAVSEEAQITLDGVSYTVGGLSGQTDFAFINNSALGVLVNADNAFTYSTHRTGVPTARFDWTPGMRFSDPTAAWPPKGITLEIDFVAPANVAVAAHKDVVVTVVYAMYDNLPLYEKYVVVNNAKGASKVVVDALAVDVLYPTREALGYWPRTEHGLLTATSSGGRIQMQSEQSRGSATTSIPSDSRCTTCVQVRQNRLQGARNAMPCHAMSCLPFAKYSLCLTRVDTNEFCLFKMISSLSLNSTFTHIQGAFSLLSSYPLGPGAEVGPGGFHGTNFTSFHTYVLVHDTDDTERQGLAMRKMYRTLAPQVTENPVFMHLTRTDYDSVKAAVDQCAEARALDLRLSILHCERFAFEHFAF